MPDKFRYAPGRPGYGTKGNDGSAGLQGFSMYFTDYDPLTETASINLAIQNNYVLWSISATTALPSSRVYITGDLFVDTEGKIYEINAELNTFTYKFASINTTGYFTSAEIVSDTYNYNRYFNTNISPKYVIDNVYADGAIAYYNVPTNVYNILSKNYARIEYSNVTQGNYNPFTLFSSAETGGTDDHKALAIVREIDSNTFRIGNLDNTGNIRDVNLIFDVSSLKHTKQGKSLFNIGSPDGEILTNYEINANALFTGVFNISPPGFYAGYGVTDISIRWRLIDFTADPDVKADLYFLLNEPYSGTISLATDGSAFRPYVFHDCASSGVLHFSGLPETTSYKYYMNFYKNGWERRSNIKTVATGAAPTIAVYPSSVTNDASGAHTLEFCVSSNVIWEAVIYTNPGTFLSGLVAYGTAVADSSLRINLSENTTELSRAGALRVTPTNGGVPITVNISQAGAGGQIELDMVQASGVCNDGYPTKDYTINGEVDVTGLISSNSYSINFNTNIYINNFFYEEEQSEFGEVGYEYWSYLYVGGTVVDSKHGIGTTQSSAITNLNISMTTSPSPSYTKVAYDSSVGYMIKISAAANHTDYQASNILTLIDVSIAGTYTAYNINNDNEDATIPCVEII